MLRCVVLRRVSCVASHYRVASYHVVLRCVCRVASCCAVMCRSCCDVLCSVASFVLGRVALRCVTLRVAAGCIMCLGISCEAERCDALGYILYLVTCSLDLVSTVFLLPHLSPKLSLTLIFIFNSMVASGLHCCFRASWLPQGPMICFRGSTDALRAPRLL